MFISGRWEMHREESIISAFASQINIGISVAQKFDCYA
jgi:hypothetical protein